MTAGGRLVARRNSGETWRQAVARIAGKQGLDSECLEIFDDLRWSGYSDDRAALYALSEWDCLDYEE